MLMVRVYVCATEVCISHGSIKVSTYTPSKEREKDHLVFILELFVTGGVVGVVGI